MLSDKKQDLLKFFLHILIGITGIFMLTSSYAELIVLASPMENDTYYKKTKNDIIAFQIAYAKKIIKSGGRVLILTNSQLYDQYAHQLGADNVLNFPMQDIWIRDFTLANPVKSVMFHYTAAGQGGGKTGQIQSDAVQDDFYALAKKANLSFKSSDLLNDGGNFVDDYAGNVVVSTKFLDDNHLSEGQAREKLQRLTGAKHIAFIEADEQGGLEHVDGIVSFIAPNTIIINDYAEDPDYMADLKRSLKQGLPGVKIHELVMAYNGKHIYDGRFGSACGLYTNMLVTKKRIYFPQFGIPEDKIALEELQALTTKEIIPVLSSQVCDMGGGVRCMSLQLRGKNAEKLLHYAHEHTKTVAML